MIALLWFLLTLFASPLKSKSRLEAENAALRYQLIVLRRKVGGRVRLTNGDRLFFIQLYRWFPSVLKVITVIRPETLVRWHRAGFRRYWCWKSRPFGGRPQIDAELRALIRRMSIENPLWGAPRIHGELLKLGFEVAQSSVAKYMVKRRGRQVRDGAPSCAITCRRSLPWICSSCRPLASICSTPSSSLRYLIRDRDCIYGTIVTRQLHAMGIRDKPIAPASPWQNGFAERLIGSIRRECLNHIVVSGEAHLRRVLRTYAGYYNRIRTHRSLDNDAPIFRPVQSTGSIKSHPILGGLHHH